MNAKKADIEFSTSPAYDYEAVDEVNNLVNFFKIGSGDISWTQVIEYVVSKNKPVILATGAADLMMLNRAVSHLLVNG